MRLIPKRYIIYKFLNSSFTGLSIGSIFTIYAPLKPSIYSIGGILLAIAMIIIAKFYEKIMNVRYFFIISIFVEFVILFLVIFFLIHPYTYMTALLIYAGYQVTFAFGSYLVRAETLIVRKKRLLTLVDVYKQSGYLAGLLISFIFYKILEYKFGVKTNEEKVYDLHYLLLIVEIGIIYSLYKSFKFDTRFK